MDITRRSCLIALLAILLAFTCYGQNQRVQSLQASAGVTTAVLRATSHATFVAGTTNSGPTTTRQNSPLLISGGFSLIPTLIAAVGTVEQGTNAYQWWTTNASFSVSFGGTPSDGSRGQFDIKNTAATNIIVTWPSSWSVAQAALTTTFTAVSNSITEVFWYYEGGSNRVRVASKEIVENFLNPTAGQVVSFHDAHTKTNITVAGTGDVTAAANFSVDNVVIRSDGTSKGVQASGITLDDSNNLNTPGGLRGQTANVTNTLVVGGVASLNGGGTTTTPSTGDNDTSIPTTAFVQNTLIASNLQIRAVYREIWIPAGAMTPAAVSGPSTNSYVGADGRTVDIFSFDDTTPETNYFTISFPDVWDRGTIKAKYFWSATTGTAAQGVTWGIAGAAISDDDVLTTAHGTRFTIVDAYIASGDLHVSAATSAITIGGTPALNDMVLFELVRVQDVGDDKTGDANLLGVKIQYRESSTDVALW